MDFEWHRVVTAWLNVGAVIIGAIALVLTQRRANFDRKNAIQSIAHEGLIKFVELNAQNPELCLMEPEKRAEKVLSRQELEIERSAYLLLLLTYERAFFYSNGAKQQHKIDEIERLISAYASFENFHEAVELYLLFADEQFTKRIRKLIGHRPKHQAEAPANITGDSAPASVTDPIT